MRREEFYTEKIKAATDGFFSGEDELLLKVTAKKPQSRIFKTVSVLAACAVIVISVFLLQRFVFLNPVKPGEQTGAPTLCPTGAEQTTQASAEPPESKGQAPVVS